MLTAASPVEKVAAIFKESGVTSGTACGTILIGTFPCKTPPNIGFGFPPQSANASTSPKSYASTVFTVPSDLMAQRNYGNGTCLSALQGEDFNNPETPDLWVIGHRTCLHSAFIYFADDMQHSSNRIISISMWRMARLDLLTSSSPFSLSVDNTAELLPFLLSAGLSRVTMPKSMSC